MFERIADGYRGSTVVLVGCGGIGREIAVSLVDLAGSLVLIDHDSTAVESTRRWLEGLPQRSARLLSCTLDVRDAAQVQQRFRELRSELAVVDFLFYTAGVLTIEPFLETDTDDWRRSVEVNLNGAFYCVQACAGWMAERRHGSILLLGSIAGTRARSGSRVNPVYNATKAGIAAFVNSCAMQLRGSGVRINSISPGPTATAMMERQPPHVHEAVRQICLDHRMNSAAEVAELALYVAAHGRFTGEDVAMGGGAGLGG
ncbi:MAG: SDR family oxidoreductase [Planctomycetes bacterium]|nr:SDR family oxidoreductase [Planctomycetota bacterium]